MSRFIGDLMYPNDKYIHRESGEERTSWLKCGGVFKNEQGAISVKIDALPTCMGENKWFRVFEPREDQNSRRTNKPAPAQSSPIDDTDIPF